MKNCKINDKSAPYRTNRGGKITAPTKNEGEPKCTAIKSERDLRGGK